MTEITSAFTPEGHQLVWDSTSIKRVETCLRKYQYEALEGWRSPYRSVHLWFGGLYASSLESFHKLCASGESVDDALHSVITTLMIESWDHDRDEDGNRVPGTGHAASFDNPSKNRENLVRSVIWYIETFRDEQYKTFITSSGKAAVEFTFKLSVDNGYIFSGHIDRLCIDEQEDIFVHDQKTTTTTLSPHYFNQFKPDTQFSMYTFAGKMIYNAPVKGVIIDAAQVAVGFTRFARSPTYRTEEELSEWYDETMWRIEQVRAAVDNNYFPRNPASCNNYGGCPFREVCSRPPHVRDNFLSASFTQGPRWDPLIPR